MVFWSYSNLLVLITKMANNLLFRYPPTPRPPLSSLLSSPPLCVGYVSYRLDSLYPQGSPLGHAEVLCEKKTVGPRRPTTRLGHNAGTGTALMTRDEPTNRITVRWGAPSCRQRLSVSSRSCRKVCRRPAAAHKLKARNSADEYTVSLCAV